MNRFFYLFENGCKRKRKKKIGTCRPVYIATIRRRRKRGARRRKRT